MQRHRIRLKISLKFTLGVIGRPKQLPILTCQVVKLYVRNETRCNITGCFKGSNPKTCAFHYNCLVVKSVKNVLRSRSNRNHNQQHKGLPSQMFLFAKIKFGELRKQELHGHTKSFAEAISKFEPGIQQDSNGYRVKTSKI